VKRFAFLLGLAVMAATASTARATIVYQYVTDVGSASTGSTFTGTAGETFSLNVFISQTGGDLIAKDGGLFGGGFQLTRTGSGSTLGWVSGATAGTPFSSAGGSFSVSPSSFGQTTSSYRMANLTSLSATSGPNPDANGLIQLANVTFTIGTANTVWTLKAKSSGAADTTTFNNQYDLDTDNNGGLPGTGGGGTQVYNGAKDLTWTINLNVSSSATPEPGSMALCGIAACTFGFGAWRRRQARKAAAAEVNVENPAV
jgi:hypothetical protein